MMKYLIKGGLFVLLLLSLVSPVLLVSSVAHADDPNTDPPPGITAIVGISGDNPDVGVDIYGNGPDVWINGEHLGSITDTVTSTVTSNLNNKGGVNSTYSGASTGFLPPLSNNSGVAAVAPGKYDAPLIGWQGYFCPHENTDPSVYAGSGCGGTWGVCDGYPDFWTRRQIAGLAPEFIIQKEKLDTVITAVAKIIGMTQQNTADLNGKGVVADLKQQLSGLQDLSLDVSVLYEEQIQLKAAIQKQQAAYDQKLTTITVVFAVVLVCVAALVAFLAVYLWQVRRRLKHFGY